MVRRGLTWFARVHIPRDRWKDVGRALGSRGGEKRDVVRTLKTTNRQEALRRLDIARAEIRAEIDAKLRAIGLPALAGDWRPEARGDWEALALSHRAALASASDRPFNENDDEHLSPRSLVRDRISDTAGELHRTHGEDAAAAYWSVAMGGGLTIREAADRWLATVEGIGQRRHQTIAGHRAALGLLEAYLKERHDVPSLDVAPLGSFSRRMAAGFIEWRQSFKSQKTGRAVSAATLRKELSSVSGLWRWAMRSGDATLNPWSDQSAGLADPRKGRRGDDDEGQGGKRPYSPAELVTLLHATGEDWAPNGGGYAATLWDAVRLGLLTGCRAEELASLRIGDIVDGGSSIRIRAGKTRSARRTIPLHILAQRVVAARLADLPDTSPTAPLFPELPVQGADGKRGKMLTTRYGTAMRRIMKAAGEPAEGVDLHSLRRSFAQHVRNGMQAVGSTDATMLGTLMGHAESSLALRVYGPDTLPAHLRRAVDLMADHGLPKEVRRALEETANQRPKMTRFAPQKAR